MLTSNNAMHVTQERIRIESTHITKEYTWLMPARAQSKWGYGFNEFPLEGSSQVINYLIWYIIHSTANSKTQED